MRAVRGARRGVRGTGWPPCCGGGAILAACLLAAGGAHAYTSYSATEGNAISVSQPLPTFPHEARRVSQGYSAVRYTICTEDGSATGATWVPFRTDYPEGTDYLRFCGYKWQLNSTNNYSKQIKIQWNTREDDDKEGDEYFWLYLKDPEVKRPGSNTWQSHGGSHHVPSTIKIQMVITDDD